MAEVIAPWLAETVILASVSVVAFKVRVTPVTASVTVFDAEVRPAKPLILKAAFSAACVCCNPSEVVVAVSKSKLDRFATSTPPTSAVMLLEVICTLLATPVSLVVSNKRKFVPSLIREALTPASAVLMASRSPDNVLLEEVIATLTGAQSIQRTHHRPPAEHKPRLLYAMGAPFL